MMLQSVKRTPMFLAAGSEKRASGRALARLVDTTNLKRPIEKGTLFISVVLF